MAKINNTKLVILIIAILIIMTGCQPVPDSVKNSIPAQLVDLSEITNENGRNLKMDFNNILSIDAVVKIPDIQAINSYEMIPAEFDKDVIFKAFDMNSNDFEVTQGSINSNPEAPDYEPVVLENSNYSLYMNLKRGRYNFANMNLNMRFISGDNEVSIDSVDSSLDLSKSEEMISIVMQRLGIDYVIDDIKAYNDGEKYYYYFNLAQVFDGIKLDDEYNPTSMDTLVNSHGMNFVIDKNGIVMFESTLCMIKQKSDTYDKMISLDTTLKIINQKINLIVPENTDFITKNGEVLIDNVNLMYIAQLIDYNDNHFLIRPVWSFTSGLNIGTNRYCNIKIDAITGELY